MIESRTGRSARRTLSAAIVALAGASAAYRVLVANALEHTSLVFIGIPTLIALLVLGVQPRSASGTVYKTIGLGLCLSGIVFGEAMVCILMAAPLFFGIGALVARGADDGLGSDDRPSSLRKLGVLMLLPMSLEGVIPGFELPREYAVTVRRVVAGTPAQVRQALAAPMRFDAELPLFFRLGYPTPGAVAGAGLAVGDTRRVEFHHGHHPGTLRLDVVRSDERAVSFAAISDDSYITHWLSWRGADVTWTEIAPGRTEVRWTLRYWRRLDPAWYFAPLERYGVTLAAGYLIETLATPRIP